ncbi:MAG: hypothetical protein CMO01_14530 [Thalassobius sp.]|nr:hypothetical protein [Thalassovita sp.]
MVLTLQIFISIYLAVSTAALVIYLYKKFLQFLSPIKGYIVGGLLIVSLLTFDLAMFSFTSAKITNLNQQNTSQISYYN